MTKYVILAAAIATFNMQAETASAQNAEETVAFILHGVEDGRKIAIGSSSVATVTETSRSPAAFAISPPGKLDVDEVSVREVEKCRFEVKAKRAQKTTTSVMDFQKLNDVKFTLGIGLLNFSGRCAIKGGDGSCNSVAMITADMGTPAQRIRKAISFLKDNYCSGSAF
jgi:hypothetical protein